MYSQGICFTRCANDSLFLQLSVTALNAIRYMSAESVWANEGGDPCVPAHWEWINCSSTPPPRITKM